MINRVLIRMKTVQLLYSYLLVEKPFYLESSPSAPTKEKRFAYNLYLDLIYLMVRLAKEVVGKNKSKPLANSRFILRAENDDTLKSLVAKYSESEIPFSAIIPNLVEELKGSLLFKDYENETGKGNQVDDFWEKVFNAIILPNVSLMRLIRELPGYSLSGVERMKVMMETTFRNFYATRDDISDAIKTLEKSMKLARDLYMRLLALTVELTSLRMHQLEQGMKKVFATREDLHPNMRFVSNEIPRLIEQNPDFEKYVEENHLSWKEEDPELLNVLLTHILESETYKNYMDSDEPQTLDKDVRFWKDVLVDVILNDRDFLEYLENKSVFWNDDLETMASFVLKTFSRLESEDNQQTAILPMYKDGEEGRDAKFGAELFKYVVKNKDLYRHYIEEGLKEEKWDADRLAFMDMVITMTALAEIINYPDIPLSVSINEYIEIAKSYSSEKSGQFVHGLLATLIPMLRDKKLMLK